MSIRSLGGKLLDAVEILLPSITFVVMFLVFLAEIVARYCFNNPLVWTYEVSTLAYTWTIIIGACYAARKRVHITFDLVFDMFSPRTRLVVESVGNLTVVIFFAIALYPSFDFISFSKVSKTPVLLIPMNIGFFPFLVFLILVSAHLLRDTWRNLRQLAGKDNEGHTS